jgi:hypothetical protein
MVAIATENFESELKFGESSGVMRFDPASIDFDSKWSTIAETRLFTVNQKWMFGELTVSYPLSFFDDPADGIGFVKDFFYWLDGDQPRQGITTDLHILKHADRWELTLTFVNVSSMLV